MKIVASYTDRRLDAIKNETAWNAINRGFCYQLVVEVGVTYQTARQHITRACRQQRHPECQPPDGWGGSRPGAGRNCT